MDIVSNVITVMSSVSQAVTLAKDLRDADLKISEAESKHRISELYNTLSDIKMSVADLKIELLNKDEEIAKLKLQLEVQTSMEYSGRFYYRKINGTKIGPYCPQCYDNSQKVINLHNYSEGWYECKTCKSQYEEDFRARELEIARNRTSIYDEYE